MEVHHHPHIEKKSFKEYLLEGLMIFLAVTMGFIAENIREHIGDRSKEKEYIINIKKDLKEDITNLDLWLSAMKGTIRDMDTLVSLLANPGKVDRGNDLYYLARLSTRKKLFEQNDNTLVDLKSSGNFRLIRNKEVISKLINFEKFKVRYLKLDEVATSEAELMYPLIGNLFDATVFTKMFTSSADTSVSTEHDFAESSKRFLQKPTGNPQLRNTNPDVINQLMYNEIQVRGTLEGELRILTIQKQEATELILLIDKEYHLQNEY